MSGLVFKSAIAQMAESWHSKLREPHSAETTAHHNFHVVAFVDLLGFSAMIEEDPNGQRNIPLIESAIAAALAFAKVTQSVDADFLGYRIFSDNICFWMPFVYGPFSLCLMMSVLSEFQLEMTLHGILCRGGISIGTHHVSEHTLYGPALLEAVSLEKSVSTPCIAISHRIVEYPRLLSAALQFHMFHKIEEERPFFVNYLSKVFYIEKVKSLDLVQRHACVIQSNMEKFKANLRILAKYQWARDYHNDLIGMIKFEDECARVL